VAIALGLQGNPQMLPLLIAALKDDSWEIRQSAADALGTLGDPQAVPALLEVLKDADGDIQRSAAVTLHALGHHEGISALIALLNEQVGGISDEARFKAALVLVRINDDEGLRALRANDYFTESFISRLKPLAPNPEEIVHALEVIGTPKALAAVANWRKRFPTTG
jgi:HEAT repeat protein